MLPRLRRTLRRPRVPQCDGFDCQLVDARVGNVRLTGALHDPPGSTAVILLVHGLGGDADSDYLRVAAAAAARAGLASLRLNLRGSDLLGEDYYHAGLCEDLATVLAAPALARYERCFALGYSIGGHLVLRLATGPPVPRLAAVAAVCPPLDLGRAAHVLDHDRWAAPYRRYVLASLKQIYAHVAARHAVHTPVERVERVRRIQEWDDLVVAPRFGFADALDYYRRESVGPRLPDLAVPTLLVSAMHDPMVAPEAVAPWVERAPDALTMRWVSDGGHLGFPARVDLGLGLQGGGGSLESQVLAWLRRN
jgi:predicted alpha/beta-fold hydrolase